jgi:hypothetical protein
MPGREYAFRDAERPDDAPGMATLEPFIGRRLLWDEQRQQPPLRDFLSFPRDCDSLAA